MASKKSIATCWCCQLKLDPCKFTLEVKYEPVRRTRAIIPSLSCPLPVSFREVIPSEKS
jgi:hypothetical protein